MTTFLIVVVINVHSGNHYPKNKNIFRTKMTLYLGKHICEVFLFSFEENILLLMSFTEP